MLKPCFCSNNPEVQLVVAEHNLTLDLLEIYLPKQYDFLGKMLDSFSKQQQDAMATMMLNSQNQPRKENLVIAGDSENIFTNNVLCIDKGRVWYMPWKTKTNYIGVTKRGTLGIVKEVANPSKHVTIPAEASQTKSEEVVYYPGNVKHKMITIAPTILEDLERGEMVQVVSYEQYKLDNDGINSSNMIGRTEYNIYLYMHNGKVKADVEMVQYPNIEDWQDVAQTISKEKDREFSMRTTYEVPQYLVNRMMVVNDRRKSAKVKELETKTQPTAEQVVEATQSQERPVQNGTDRLLKLMLEENKKINQRRVKSEGISDEEMGDGR